MDKLPEKLFEVKCEVIVKYEDCALVLTKVRYLSSCKEFQKKNIIQKSRARQPLVSPIKILFTSLKISQKSDPDQIWQSLFFKKKVLATTGSFSLTTLQPQVARLRTRPTAQIAMTLRLGLTVLCMAPEIIRGRKRRGRQESDERSENYVLGVITVPVSTMSTMAPGDPDM